MASPAPPSPRPTSCNGLLEVPASQNGYPHSSTSPLPPHSPLSPGGPLAGSVSPHPNAHHSSHINNHIHPSHHQQTQAGHLLGAVAGIINKKEPVDELPQRNLRVVIPSGSSNTVTAAQSAHVNNNNHNNNNRNSAGEELLHNANVSSSSSSSNPNYNGPLTTSTSAAVANNNNNNNIHSFVTSLTNGGEDNNLNHNPHNSTGPQNFTANGEVQGVLSAPNPTSVTTSSLTVNDLTNLSSLQAAANAWNQQNTSQPAQQQLAALNIVGQANAGGMSSSSHLIPQLNISTSTPPHSPSSGCGTGNGLRVKVEPLSPREPPYPSINRITPAMHQQHNLSRPHSAHSSGLSPGPCGVQPLSPGVNNTGHNNVEVRNHQPHNQTQPLHLAVHHQNHFNDNSSPMPLQKRLRVSTESAGSGGIWSS